MKYIIVIGDGMADTAVPALGGKTPLQAAKKPQIDALSRAGELGTVRTVPPGMAPGSDTAILSIFGYDPRRYFSGRSPLEAAGMGVALQEGDVSYRVNMVTLSQEEENYEEKRLVLHSGGGIEGEEAMALMEALLENKEFSTLSGLLGMRFRVFPSYRHVGLQNGVDVAGLVCTPPHDHLTKTLGPLLPKGSAAAQGLCALQQLSYNILANHPINRRRQKEGKLPANSLWFWAQGTSIVLPNFEKEHTVTGFVVSAVPLVQGIARLAGLAVVAVEGATGELDTNFEGKADAIVKGLLGGCDFALLHVEAPDECTHNGDVPGKVQAIEWLDSRCVAPVLEGLRQAGEAFRLLLLSDHKTLTATRAHNGDPVPYLLYDSRGVKAPSGRPYTEAEAALGPHVPEGSSLVGRLFEG